MNHFLSISDEALFFGCQKRNGLIGENTAKLDASRIFAFLGIIRHGCYNQSVSTGSPATISAKIPHLNELHIALLFLVLGGGKKNISLKTKEKLKLAFRIESLTLKIRLLTIPSKEK